MPTNCADLKNPRWLFHPEKDPAYEHFVHIGKPFEPGAGSVTSVNACWLADAALLSYWDPGDVSARCARVDLRSEAVSAGGTDSYIMTSPAGRWAILAFRGTQPDQFQDIADDADFEQVGFEGGRVHRGFRNAFDRVAGTLEQHIRSLEDGGLSIWVAGHSLGAALATMTAMLFRNSIAGICTLGSPRVGDPEFVRAFDGHFGPRSARYVNDHDLVARVPPELIGLFGIGLHYQHVGQLRFIDGNGVISGGAAEPSFFGDVFGNPRLIRTMFATSRLAAEGQRQLAGAIDQLVPESLLDHMPKAYACTIRRQVR